MPATAISIRSCFTTSATPSEVRRAIEAGRDILKACVAMGGCLTGEHGIGAEKMAEMPLLFSPDDLIVMSELRRVFDPDRALESQQSDSDARLMRRSGGAAPAGAALMHCAAACELQGA